MFEDKEEKGREEIIDYALKLSRAGLNVNSSGNLSVRFDSPEGKGFLITPTGLPYDETEPEDLVRILFTDNGCYKAVGSRQPSSEWNLHAFLYQTRPDINAVVHTHSPYATMLSCLDEAIPPFHYMVAAVGGDTLPCVPYATFGSVALAEGCRDTLGKDRLGCLLSHHGSVAAGRNLKQAYAVALEIESLARMWMNLKQIGGCPLIDKEEMARVKEQFKTYGQQEKGHEEG